VKLTQANASSAAPWGWVQSIFYPKMFWVNRTLAPATQQPRPGSKVPRIR